MESLAWKVPLTTDKRQFWLDQKMHDFSRGTMPMHLSVRSENAFHIRARKCRYIPLWSVGPESADALHCGTSKC